MDSLMPGCIDADMMWSGCQSISPSNCPQITCVRKATLHRLTASFQRYYGVMFPNFIISEVVPELATCSYVMLKPSHAASIVRCPYTADKHEIFLDVLWRPTISRLYQK